MMLSYEQIKMFRKLKKNSDSLKMNYLNEQDIEVCNFVIDQLPSFFDVGVINSGRNISMDELIQMSLREIMILGSDIQLKIFDLLDSVSIDRHDDDYFGFSTIVTYNTDISKNNVCINTNSGKVEQFLIPKEIFEISGYCICHEYVHALKETNYNEYINAMTLGEVIPIFYELLVFNPDDVLKKELIKLRINSVYISKIDYLLLCTEIIKKDVSKYGLFYFLRSKAGCYLNGFYYALILYSMYKETPKKILDLVSKVLKHEITTLQMLKLLDIYGDIRGEVFERELGNIKKLVK